MTATMTTNIQTGLDNNTLKALGKTTLGSVLSEFLYEFKSKPSGDNYAKLEQVMLVYQELCNPQYQGMRAKLMDALSKDA